MSVRFTGFKVSYGVLEPRKFVQLLYNSYGCTAEVAARVMADEVRFTGYRIGCYSQCAVVPAAGLGVYGAELACAWRADHTAGINGL